MATPRLSRNGGLHRMRTPTMVTLLCALPVLIGTDGMVNAAPGDEIYARPGQLVTAQGTRLNFYCMGGGSPTVVFDSGWGDWAPVWTIVQPEGAEWKIGRALG